MSLEQSQSMVVEEAVTESGGPEQLAAPRNRTTRERLLHNPTALVSIGILVLITFGAIAAPLLTSYDPLLINPGQRLRSPRAEHLFGTDYLGRDVFAIVLYGARTSLLAGLLITVLSMTIATILGLLSGLYHKVDVILMRVVDGLMSFPGIVLATAAAGYFGPSFGTVVLALTIVLIWPSLRIVRGSALVARELLMVEAGRSIGVPESRILTKYVFPIVRAPILVQTSFIFSAAVLGEAGLSFIGLGVGSKTVSWGSALTESRNYIQNGWWIAVFPGVALVLTILALNLLGDALRDILDPRLARR
ncbi:MAG TPA: ABC transporter permease [Chloroflexia bacterium]|nr:ABC transporter permease [Chloroflexia bacterium]